jgi:hypothetical protein
MADHLYPKYDNRLNVSKTWIYSWIIMSEGLNKVTQRKKHIEILNHSNMENVEWYETLK